MYSSVSRYDSPARAVRLGKESGTEGFMYFEEKGLENACIVRPLTLMFKAGL
jgi:hypothetical protein